MEDNIPTEEEDGEDRRVDDVEEDILPGAVLYVIDRKKTLTSKSNEMLLFEDHQHY